MCVLHLILVQIPPYLVSTSELENMQCCLVYSGISRYLKVTYKMVHPPAITYYKLN